MHAPRTARLQTDASPARRLMAQRSPARRLGAESETESDERTERQGAAVVWGLSAIPAFPAAGAAKRNVVRRQPARTSTQAPPTNCAPIPYEKWAPELEAVYRQRGDMRRAEAMRNCRDRGGEFCARIIPLADVEKAHAMAIAAKGNERVIGERLSKPQMGFVGPVGGFLSTTGAAAEGGAATATAATATSTASTATTAATATAAEGGVAGGAGVGAGSVIVPLAVVALFALAASQMWSFGRLITELEALGYVVLGDPLGECIGNCHKPGGGRTPGWFDRPLPDFPIGPTWPGAPTEAQPRPTFPWTPPSGPDHRTIGNWTMPSVPLQPAAPRPGPRPVSPVPPFEERKAEPAPILPPAGQRPARPSTPAPTRTPTPAEDPDGPVMPDNLPPDLRRRWRECKELHDEYKGRQLLAATLSRDIKAAMDALRRDRSLTPAQRAARCRQLEKQIIRISRMLLERDAYIWQDCDMFDWFNRGETQDARLQGHLDQKANAASQLSNLQENFRRLCDPEAE